MHPDVETLSAWADGELPDRADVREHVESCVQCRGLVEDLRALGRAMAAEVPPVPADLESRVVQSLRFRKAAPSWWRVPALAAATIAVALIAVPVLMRQPWREPRGPEVIAPPAATEMAPPEAPSQPQVQDDIALSTPATPPPAPPSPPPALEKAVPPAQVREAEASRMAAPERQEAAYAEGGATGADAMQDAAPAAPEAMRKQANEEVDELRRESVVTTAPVAGAAPPSSALSSAVVAQCDPGGDLVWPRAGDPGAQQRLRAAVERAGGRITIVTGRDLVWSVVVPRPGWETVARELAAQGVTAVDPSRPPAGESCLQMTLRAPG